MKIAEFKKLVNMADIVVLHPEWLFAGSFMIHKDLLPDGINPGSEDTYKLLGIKTKIELGPLDVSPVFNNLDRANPGKATRTEWIRETAPGSLNRLFRHDIIPLNPDLVNKNGSYDLYLNKDIADLLHIHEIRVNRKDPEISPVWTEDQKIFIMPVQVLPEEEEDENC